MLFKRVAAVLALVLGMAGMAVCLAGAYGVWRVKSRLDRANDQVFAAVDQSLEVVQERMPVVQQRVRESKVAATEVADAVRPLAEVDGKRADRVQGEGRGHVRRERLRLEGNRGRLLQGQGWHVWTSGWAMRSSAMG